MRCPKNHIKSILTKNMDGNIRASKRAVWFQTADGRMLYKRTEEKIKSFTAEFIILKQAFRSCISHQPLHTFHYIFLFKLRC